MEADVQSDTLWVFGAMSNGYVDSTLKSVLNADVTVAPL